MYICVGVRIYTCIYIYIYIYTYTVIYIDIDIYIFIHTHTHTHIYIYTHKHIRQVCLFRNQSIDFAFGRAVFRVGMGGYEAKIHLCACPPARG